jgi:hypothetical protein
LAGNRRLPFEEAFMRPALAVTSVLWPLTAQRFRVRCWRANCSAMKGRVHRRVYTDHESSPPLRRHRSVSTHHSLLTPATSPPVALHSYPPNRNRQGTHDVLLVSEPWADTCNPQLTPTGIPLPLAAPFNSVFIGNGRAGLRSPASPRRDEAFNVHGSLLPRIAGAAQFKMRRP